MNKELSCRICSAYLWVLKRTAFVAAWLLTSAGVDSLYADTALVEADRYIVQLKDTAALSRGDLPYLVEHRYRHFDVVIPKTSALRAKSSESATEPLRWSKVARDCAEIMRNPDVDSCDPNLIRRLAAVPNDPGFSSQWALSELSNSADINVQSAWDRGVGSKSILVGVIDSGIQSNHPDLTDNIWINPSETLDGVDNDGNGYVDDISGANTAFGNNDIRDCQGHGTHVAGIIGARGNNSVGVSGINWVTSIITARTDIHCHGWVSLQAVINAYDYFTDLKLRGHDVRVVNASFGGSIYSQAEYDAIARMNAAGILLVAAAGNESANLDSAPLYPAAIPLPNVVAVAATGPGRSRAQYSNYGGSSVHIAAPGGDGGSADGGIYSTWSAFASPNALYRSIQGTSMATPMVTGALALIASQRSALSGLQLRQLLLNSAEVLPQLQGVVQAARFINVAGMSTGITPLDQCLDDENKFEPGVCGCGSADADLNANGIADCLDPSVRNIVPARPLAMLRGRRLFLFMENRAGVEWYIDLNYSSRARSSQGLASRNRYFVSSRSKLWLRIPVRGVRAKVRYAFRVIGSRETFSSSWSNYRDLGVVP
jgi:subtilisin family serine protease